MILPLTVLRRLECVLAGTKELGLVGYEINFNRYFYFYRYTPPRPLEAIEADIRTIEGDIVRMLAEMTAR